MLKYIFFFILLLHGLIHGLGFAKAYGHGTITLLTREISKTNGVCWLISAALFLSVAFLYFFKNVHWPYLAVIAVVLSQILIVTVWNDAKYGTILNGIILISAIVSWAAIHFEDKFKEDVKRHFTQTVFSNEDMLTENDIIRLPAPVQQYIRYSGAMNKPKVKNMRIVFDGEMREKGKDFFKFHSEQYNFFDEPTRLFFMKANMFGTTVPGYHRYQNATATMQVKLLGLLNMVNMKGNEMNQAETVTVFNDMCLMAPASLIDNRIEWTLLDSLTAKATFTNGINKISANLYFNEKGQLVNFISDDRYEINAMQRYRFSTPVKEYVQMNGRMIWKQGETRWLYPDGEFVYGKFTLKGVDYNVSDF